MTIGIYEIENIKTGQKYRGQSNDIERRLKEHARGKNHDQWVDRSIKSNGIDSFTCRILEVFDEYDKDLINKREKYWINEGNTFNNPFHYNLSPGGDDARPGDENPMYRHDLDDKKIVELYIDQQLTTYEIANILNTCASTIGNRLKKNDIELRGNKYYDFDDEIIDLYVNKQLSVIKIGKKLNIDSNTVQYHLKKNNIKLRGPRRYYLDDKIIDLYINKQLSVSKISKELNMSRSGVEYRLKKNNIELRGYGRNDIPSSHELLEEYNSSNITLKELSIKYNCHIGTIRYRLNKDRGGDVNGG